MSVHGYQEEGTITTPFDMRVQNEIDRFNLVKDAIIRKNDKGSDYVLFTLSVPQTGTKWYDYINCIAFNENAAIIAKSPLKGTPYHI